ncbi:hypothetical protein GEO60473_22010 [Geobacter sp. 60473]|nr:hypothetical protein GEO60473_22010 [Geobacter sp. 60473]
MEMNKWVFSISFAFLLGVSTAFGYAGNIGAMSLSIVAGAIGMAFANLDKFQKIKGAGFEAELKKAVEKAYATTSSLKDLAADLASTVLVIMAAEGRWGGMGLKRKMELRQVIDEAVKKVGLTAKEIKETHLIFDQFLLWDHGRAIIEEFNKSGKVDNEARELLNSLTKYETLTVSPPAEFRELHKKLQIENKEIEELIKDLEHFQKKQTLRRPDRWYKHD